MRIQTIFIFLCVVLLSTSLSAQQFHTPHTQYLHNPYIFNPARAGFGEGYPNVFLNYRRQWAEMPNSPITKILTADGRLGIRRDANKTRENPFDDVGVGGIFYQDNTFLIQRTGGIFSYAYHFLPLPQKGYEDLRFHQFSMGLSTGFLSQSIDYSQVRVEDIDDSELFTDRVSQTVFDLGFGMAYHYNNKNEKKSFETLDVDLSVIHAPGAQISYFNDDGGVFNDTDDSNNGIDDDVRNYDLLTHFIGGINMEFHIPPKHLGERSGDHISNFYMKPGMLVRAAQGKPVQFDLSLVTKFELKDMVRVVFGGGMKTSPENPVVGVFSTVGLQLTKSTSIYYNFESLHNQPLGFSHEILVGYTFGQKSKKEFDEVKETANINRIAILQQDTISIINSEFKKEYSLYIDKLKNPHKYIRGKRVLERISNIKFKQETANATVRNIEDALKKNSTSPAKVSTFDRIYVVSHQFKDNSSDDDNIDIEELGKRTKEALINIGFDENMIHVFHVDTQEETFKNRIIILKRLPKK